MVSVEELYNKCHSPKTGRFCGGAASSGGGGGSRVTERLSDKYDSKGNKRSSAERNARLAKRQAAYDKRNKDDGLPTPKVRVSGDKRADAIAITKLDRGSAERKKAAAAFEEKYGKPVVARPGGVTGGPTATPKTLLHKEGGPGEPKKAPVKLGDLPTTGEYRFLKRNKDDGLPTPTVKMTGNKRKDVIAISRLDRGSPERKRAAAAFEKRYGK